MRTGHNPDSLRQQSPQNELQRRTIGAPELAEHLAQGHADEQRLC